MEETKKGLKMREMEPEIKEFVHKSANDRYSGKRTLQRKRRKRQRDYSSWLWLALEAVIILAVILCGILLLHVPAATAILVAFLELALAVCLCRSPIWLHGLVIVGNLVLGGVFELLVFMLTACVVYLGGIWVLHVWGSR